MWYLLSIPFDLHLVFPSMDSLIECNYSIEQLEWKLSYSSNKDNLTRPNWSRFFHGYISQIQRNNWNDNDRSNEKCKCKEKHHHQRRYEHLHRLISFVSFSFAWISIVNLYIFIRMNCPLGHNDSHQYDWWFSFLVKIDLLSEMRRIKLHSNVLLFLSLMPFSFEYKSTTAFVHCYFFSSHGPTQNIESGLDR